MFALAHLVDGTRRFGGQRQRRRRGIAIGDALRDARRGCREGVEPQHFHQLVGEARVEHVPDAAARRAVAAARRDEPETRCNCNTRNKLHIYMYIQTVSPLPSALVRKGLELHRVIKKFRLLYTRTALTSTIKLLHAECIRSVYLVEEDK